MRTITKEYKVYTWEELPEDGRDKAIDRLWDINVDFEWWDSTYDDAENIGLKITSFDLGRSHEITGRFVAGAEECAHLIEREHGPDCDTYKTAMAYLQARDNAINSAPKDADGEFEDERALEDLLDDLDREFLRDILNDYLAMLTREYDYLTSRESIVETIEANEYEFTEDGRIH